ncbi:hypothetical protein [Parendozoicomonas sp. Alg238-R29]|uniref:hypothetical protein n=1 Tax=Parendozoicomonas sp. Alg238-R29 TaxID=2993446 RepID=UPI00248D5BF1|nr:hypothetical protein [Parendozoicomonas sp. Alg238-R29]
MSKSAVEKVLTGCFVFVFLWTAALSSADKGAEISVPKEMEKHLFRENQTRTSWHVINEVNHGLMAGSTILFSHLLGRLVFSRVFARELLIGAGITVDYTLSHTWREFLLRQIVRLPYGIYRYSQGINGSYSWLDSLMMESPTLITGAWEVWLQAKTLLPYGSRVIHAGETSDYKLIFHHTEKPFLSFHIDKSDDSACTEPTEQEVGLNKKLHQLSCTAFINNVDTLILTPESGSGELVACKEHNSGNICKSIWLNQSHLEVFPYRSPLWLTDIFSRTFPKDFEGAALSPLSSCIVDALAELAESADSNNTGDVHCDDMLISVINGRNMQLAYLGEGNYLLADHTDTQSLSLPELWLGNSSITKQAALRTGLVSLEGQRKPGPEYGAWRALTAARSIMYHSLLNKAFSWWQKQQIGKENKVVIDLKLTEDGLKNLDPRRVQADVERIANLKGRVVAITGSDGKSHLLNYFAGENRVEEVSGNAYSGNLVEPVLLNNGNILVEVQPSVALKGDLNLEALERLQTAWLERADQVMVTHNAIFTRNEHIYRWLSLRLDERVISKSGKFKVVINPHETFQKSDALLTNLQETVKDKVENEFGFGDVEVAVYKKESVSQQIQDLKHWILTTE